MNLNISDIISHTSNPEDIFDLLELLGPFIHFLYLSPLNHFFQAKVPMELSIKLSIKCHLR